MKTIMIRLDSDQYTEIVNASKIDGLSMGPWVRFYALKQARRVAPIKKKKRETVEEKKKRLDAEIIAQIQMAREKDGLPKISLDKN